MYTNQTNKMLGFAKTIARIVPQKLTSWSEHEEQGGWLRAGRREYAELNMSEYVYYYILSRTEWASIAFDAESRCFQSLPAFAMNIVLRHSHSRFETLANLSASTRP